VPAATPPAKLLQQVRGEGVEPSFAISKTAGLPLADPRVGQSGRWGSNPRSPAPKAGGLPLSDVLIETVQVPEALLLRLYRSVPLPFGYNCLVEQLTGVEPALCL
jgi:hypothetical protein